MANYGTIVRFDDKPNLPDPRQLEGGLVEERERRRQRTWSVLFSLFCGSVALFYLAGVGFYWNTIKDHLPFGSILSGDSTEMESAKPKYPRPHIPIPPGIKRESCVEWNLKGPDAIVDLSSLISPSGRRNPPNKTYAEYGFPSDSNFYFISRGDFAVGSFTTTQSKDRVGKDARVKIQVSYFDGKTLESVKVCKIAHVVRTWEGETFKSVGVGIFTSFYTGGDALPEVPVFDIQLSLPHAMKNKDGSLNTTLSVPRLQTDMPFFSQVIDGLSTVSFKDLRLRSLGETIDVSNVWAENIIAQTLNAAIRGTFRAWNSIILFTEKASIEANVQLQNLNSTNASSVYIVNRNGLIDVTTTLSTVDYNPGGTFNVTASNANGNISLAIPVAPVNSTLHVTAVTLRGEIDAVAPPTFEGHFDLRAIHGNSTLLALSEEPGDPEGKGRRRHVRTERKDETEVKGAIWWNKDRKNSGFFNLGTTYAPIKLVS